MRRVVTSSCAPPPRALSESMVTILRKHQGPPLGIKSGEVVATRHGWLLVREDRTLWMQAG